MSSPSSLLYPYTTNTAVEDEDDVLLCSEENITEGGIYINQELEVLCVGSILTDGEPDIVKLLNTTYELLQHYRKTLLSVDNITMSLQRTRSDLKLQHELVTRLKAELEESEKMIAKVKEKERQVSLRNKSLSGQLKAEEEECRKLRHHMNLKEQQYIHERKKRDREYTRLNERLGQLVLDKSQERKLSIKMLNNLQKQRQFSRTDEKEENVYKMVITHYEERQKELMLENSTLREMLCGMEKELVSMLNQRYDTSPPRPLENGDTKNKALKNSTDTSPESNNGENNLQRQTNGHEKLLGSGHYQMPFELVRENIEENLRDKYKRLREHINFLREGKAGPEDFHSRMEKYDEEIEELERKLADYRDIICQQEIMIEKALEEGREVVKLQNPLNESHYLKRMELLDLREEKNTDREEHLKLEEHKLLNAARQLDRDRQDFEDKKAQFLKQQLECSAFVTPNKTTSHLDSFFLGLSSTPFGLSTQKSKPMSSYRPKCPSTLSSTISKSNSTPSRYEDTRMPSIDLKHELSLTSDDGEEVLNV